MIIIPPHNLTDFIESLSPLIESLSNLKRSFAKKIAPIVLINKANCSMNPTYHCLSEVSSV
jgi:hypothetical protein